MIDVIIFTHFKQTPKFVQRITIGICNEVYEVGLYAPDGNGITYKGQPTIPGQTYPLDDDLILWLEKSLGRR